MSEVRLVTRVPAGLLFVHQRAVFAAVSAGLGPWARARCRRDGVSFEASELGQMVVAFEAEVAALAHAVDAGGFAGGRNRLEVQRNASTMSVMDACSFLGLGPRRVQQLARAGEIAGTMAGPRGPWVLDGPSVRAFGERRGIEAMGA